MEIILLIIRLFLAAIFLVAGIGKLLDPQGSEKALREFGLPEALTKPSAVGLPLAEISLAVLLVFVQTSWFGALGATLLLAIFIGGMLWQMRLGKAPDCHCFGQIHSEPVGLKSLFRNIAFAVLGLILILAGPENQGISLTDSANETVSTMQIIFGLIIIGLSVVLLVLIKNILDKQTQILRRLEVLEVIAGDGGAEVREGVGDPHLGLPIGSPITDFHMPTADGRSVRRDEILARGKPILFFNVSPNCNPCQQLLPEIGEWEKELMDKLTFVYISRGTAKENLEKFKSIVDGDILVQDDRELADLLEIRWTPTALFVSKHGTVASHPAAGDEAIRELVETIRKENLENEFVFVTKENGNGKKPLIGERVPEFSLDDLHGRKISSENFRGKKTLVTFWSTTCPHCEEMMEGLREWDKIKGRDEPNLIVFSDGETSEYEQFGLNSPIIIDEEYKISEQFGMFGTPSAVLVDERGRIVSETAIGAGQIWALLGRRI